MPGTSPTPSGVGTKPSALPATNMDRSQSFVGTTLLLGLGTLAHALWTWPRAAVLALFGGGAIVAFVAEVVVVRLGWLDHRLGRQVLGVPLYVLAGWTGTVYVAFRLALLVTAGWPAVGLAAAVAMLADLPLDPRGVAEGYWRYTDSLPGPRYAGVPWWNAAGWFLVSAATATLALPFL
jgi:uncharacterized membrane protein